MTVLDTSAASTLVRTGSESVACRPLFYDAVKGEVVQPGDGASHKAWELCTDDAKLAAKGLPAYSSSLYRYLFADDKSPLIPITADAPANANTAPITQITGGGSGKAGIRAFNPGGLMLVRQYAPIALEAFFDLLSARFGRGRGFWPGGPRQCIWTS